MTILDNLAYVSDGKTETGKDDSGPNSKLWRVMITNVLKGDGTQQKRLRHGEDRRVKEKEWLLHNIYNSDYDNE